MALETNLRGFDGTRTGSKLSNLPAVVARARNALRMAQLRQAKAYNVRRKPVSLQIGDFILVRRAAIAAQPEIAAKYRAPLIGLYQVMEVSANGNYKLELPPHLRMHPKFHISMLRLYTEPEKGRVIDRLGLTNGSDEFEVDKVVAERCQRGKRQFLVQWKGYDLAEVTWEPEENLTNAPECLAAFRANRPHEGGDPTQRAVVRYQGLLDRIVADRGMVWSSDFWRALCIDLGIEEQLATARHQQTDGQAERAIGIIKTTIVGHIGSTTKDWLAALPMLEFLHNSTPHTTTGQSPHMLAYWTDLRDLDGLHRGTTLEHLPRVPQDARVSLQKAQTAQATA
ncbi:MAG: hypothetical protein BJ554DRAFT_1976 [Olpidium bornovanus]|uniref:Chromo domain-containing protein n=1 Tax=Olpidium bornovanus TaxID=278681 RepID=A0A8H7ZQP9_9FUNG|nr:MAG: hypothetical protein BJ554DRAFT_1976 [Olpidium bornovanus]